MEVITEVYKASQEVKKGLWVVYECAVPLFNIPSCLELPECQNSDLNETPISFSYSSWGYPLPLAGQCGSWQLPVNPDDRHFAQVQEWEFCQMPFGLTGARSSFQ